MQLLDHVDEREPACWANAVFRALPYVSGLRVSDISELAQVGPAAQGGDR